MGSLFSSFYTALRGIQNAQVNLQVTGQNITNSSTEGYTRQRVDSYSLGANIGNMRYASSKVSVGNGVISTSVSQLRDPCLDLRYRKENAKVGDTDTLLSAMSDIESVIDESTTDGLAAQMANLVSQLETLSSSAGDTTAESTVKTSASLLASLFNDYSEQLDSIWDQQLTYLEDSAVNQVNQLLSNIATLNEQIRRSDISGNSALELMDSRNTMLDKLSQYMNIEIDTTTVSVGSGVTVDELSVSLIGASGAKYTLISNDEYAQFEVQTDLTSSAPVSIVMTGIDGTTETTVNDECSTGVFHAYLVMLNDNGEYDASATTEATQHGIGYYQKCLDTLASKLAEVMNDLNSTTTEDKPMFAASDGSGVITAANIMISEQWQDASGSYITSTKSTAAGGVENSGATDNILAMISAFSTDIDFTTESGQAIFTGSLQEFVSNLSNTLALEIETVSNKNETYSATLSEIDTQRQSISSVDVSEEGINLILYNQALTASSRFMTTLDEAMETILNKMGVVGR